MNYADMIRDSNNYFAYMNEQYFETYAPIIKVFKLDKIATKLDDLYGDVSHSRIFLPPFEIHAKYVTNPWVGVLNLEPYQEVEQNAKFELNFNAMVRKIRDLKYGKKASVNLTFAGSGVPSVKKEGNELSLFVNSMMVATYRMTDGICGSVKSLIENINTVPYFNAENVGEDDLAVNLIDFDRTEFRGSVFNFFSYNPIYKNMTDVIELGDAILTNKFRIYQVLNARPSGDFGWNYATYSLDCGLYPMEMLDGLPGDYRNIIERNQYGLPKINME